MWVVNSKLRMKNITCLSCKPQHRVVRHQRHNSSSQETVSTQDLLRVSVPRWISVVKCEPDTRGRLDWKNRRPPPLAQLFLAFAVWISLVPAGGNESVSAERVLDTNESKRWQEIKRLQSTASLQFFYNVFGACIALRKASRLGSS